MNLDYFRYAIEIEKCGSINRAAQNLYLSQSNLSACIRSLEYELGYKIFIRSSRGISPTPEGYLFLQSAHAILNEMDKVRHASELINGLSTISISCTWSSAFLRNFINYKEHNSPDFQDSFKETGLLQNFRDVQENRYRLALLYCFHSRTAYHKRESEKTNLTVDLIASHVPAVTLVDRSHPLASGKSVTLEDIHKYPLALFEDFPDADWLHILRIPSDQRILYLFDRGAIVDAVTGGNYISVTKKGAIKNKQTNSLLELPITDLTDDLDILLLSRSSYTLNKREQSFLQYFKDKNQW